MAEVRYMFPESLRGSTAHTPNGAISIDDSITQKDLKYLRDECNMTEIQVGEKAMTINEQIKVAEADLQKLKDKRDSRSKKK